MKTIALLLAVALGSCGQSGSLQVASVLLPRPAAGRALTPWSTPETIPAHELGQGDHPHAVALDARGDAIAIWTESMVSINETITLAYLVRVAVRPAGGHWQPPDTLSRLGLDPEVAVDAGGDAIAVWESPSGVQATTRPAGGNWSAAQTVATLGGGEPQVASDPRGNAIVVSPRQAPGHSTGVQAVLRPAGAPFSSPLTVSTSENAFHPRIAMNARGDALVVWEVDTSRGCPVRAAFRSAHGAWSAPRTLSDHYAGCGGDQRVAIDERGNGTVVWLAQRGATQFVETAGRTAGGRWSPRHVIARAPVIDETLDLGADARGDVIAVWSQTALNGSGSSIWARIRPAGRRWQAAHAIERRDGGPPSLAMDTRGDALVAWRGRRRIEAIARPAGGHWENRRTISKRAPSYVPPLAAIDQSGGGLVVWQDDAGIETSWHPSLFP